MNRLRRIMASPLGMACMACGASLLVATAIGVIENRFLPAADGVTLLASTGFQCLALGSAFAIALLAYFGRSHSVTADYLVNHDPATGLLNRQAFLGRAEERLKFARRKGLPVSVILLSLDNFEEIDAHLGAEAGDAVLAAVSHRVRAALESSDLSGRIGRDRIAILGPCNGMQETVARAAVLQTVIGGMPVPYGRHCLQLKATFAVARGPNPADSLHVLLSRLDEAVSAALHERRVLALSAGDLGLQNQTLN